MVVQALRGSPSARPNALAADLALLHGLAQPLLDPEHVAAIVRTEYGLEGEWRALHGERERNFWLQCGDGRAFVVKVATAQPDLTVLDLQCKALLHIADSDPTLPVPRLVPTSTGAPRVVMPDAAGDPCALRILTGLSGQPIFNRGLDSAGTLSESDCVLIGQVHGRLTRALQGFTHPSAVHPMAWDLANGLVLHPELLRWQPPEIEAATGPLVERLARLLPELRRLRSQLIHNDLHEGNLLANPIGPLEVTGIIDFGDLVYGAVAQDLAVAVASFVHWGSDAMRAAGAIVRGFDQISPLQDEDFQVLLDLALARMLLQLLICEFQTREQGIVRPDLELLKAPYIKTLLTLSQIAPHEAAAALKTASRGVSRASVFTPQTTRAVTGSRLGDRRKAVLGNAYLFYDSPLHLVRGSGTRLYDAAGREYLDCYNNVASVGHCHPHVVRALSDQAATLNTSTRYLHESIVVLAERLRAILPSDLDTFFFVCSGSEANDVAVQMARAFTGHRGMLVMENAYHGNTALMHKLSPLEHSRDYHPKGLAMLPPPNTYRGLYRDDCSDAGARYASHIVPAIEQLTATGYAAAGVLVDSIFDANGVLSPPADYLSRVFDRVRSSGGICIADEVQMGFARSGAHMWGFEAFGVTPDIVTMGKPMGNGHPVAAVATRRDIAERFRRSTGYFNTFGGNPVSCAVANAVLDVLHAPGFCDQVLRVGEHLCEGLKELVGRHHVIGHVHGRGLFYGIELVTDRSSRAPARHAARWVRERMRQNGVLIASTGPLGNILKIRPPLAMSCDDANLCLEVLEEAVSHLPPETLIND